jgi:predicted ATPase
MNIDLLLKRIAQKAFHQGGAGMINALRICNFKCFENQQFAFGPLTLLSGLNGTGKSSVLQSLLLLRQSYQRSLLQSAGLALNGDLAQLGTARDVFYEGATSSQFGFDVEFGDELAGSWVFDFDEKADVARSVSTPVSDAVYRTNLFGDGFQYLSAERIGPRPSFPRSDYWVREHRQLGVSGEYTSHFLSLFGERKVAQEILAHPQERTLTLKAQVDAWMGEVSPGIQVEVRSYPDIDFISLQYAFVVGKQVTNSYRSPNVGFGITFTLPVVVALLSASSGALVLLENPEAHLHPQGQVKMGELMARAASCGIQVVVESHSDHILNGVRIAVRQGILAPEQVRLHFLDRKPDQLSSHVVSPQVGRDGRIDRWPEGFFDEWDKSLEKLL